MGQQTTRHVSPSSRVFEPREAFVREHVPRVIPALLEEEVTAVLGRPPSVRRRGVDAPAGDRPGQGRPRRLALTIGTMTGRRPRVRGLSERGVSRILPLLQRRPREVGERLPQRSLPGWALGDCELARRGLLGEAAPLAAASLARLKASWQLEQEAWQQRRRDEREGVYVWAEGWSVKAGLEETKAALRSMSGALTHGQKVVLAVESGQRESKASWGAVRRELRARGLQPWRWTMAAGHLGIGAA